MSRRVRICYVINSFTVGGAEAVVLDVARKLPGDRFDVTVLSVLEQSLGAESAMRARFREAGVRTEAMNLGSIRNPLSLLRLAMYFYAHRFHIVHAHNRPSDGWSMLAGRIAGVRSALWTRHSAYQDMTARQMRRYRNLASHAPIIMAVSDTVRDNCIAVEGLPATKVVTVVNGVDTERYSPVTANERAATRAELGCPANAALLLFVGRLDFPKAPDAFVRLVERLHSSGVTVRGFVCGTGPLEAELRAAVTGNGPVQMLGLRSDIPRILGAADLLVSTSRVEGLPLNVMEAMAAGIPVVAPDIGQISGLFAGEPHLSRGLYSRPPSSGPIPDELIESWAQVVAEILADRTALSASGAIGRQVIEQSYSVEAMVQRHVQIYEKYCHG